MSTNTFNVDFVRGFGLKRASFELQKCTLIFYAETWLALLFLVYPFVVLVYFSSNTLIYIHKASIVLLILIPAYSYFSYKKKRILTIDFGNNSVQYSVYFHNRIIFNKTFTNDLASYKFGYQMQVRDEHCDKYLTYINTTTGQEGRIFSIYQFDEFAKDFNKHYPERKIQNYEG